MCIRDRILTSERICDKLFFKNTADFILFDTQVQFEIKMYTYNILDVWILQIFGKDVNYTIATGYMPHDMFEKALQFVQVVLINFFT